MQIEPEAEKEFNEAIDYYESLEPGLGYDFAMEAPFCRQASNRVSKCLA